MNPRPLGPETVLVCIIVQNVSARCGFELFRALIRPINPHQSNGIWVNPARRKWVAKQEENSAFARLNLLERRQPSGKEGTMKQRSSEQNHKITIPAADLEETGLAGFDRLELHLLDQVAVVIPGEMTAKELIDVSASLLKLTNELIDNLLGVCSDCDDCGGQGPCSLVACGLPGGRGETESSGEDLELFQLSPEIQRLLREHKVCLLNLEEKLRNGDWVYPNGYAVSEGAELLPADQLLR